MIAVGAAGTLVRRLGEPYGRAIIADQLAQALRGEEQSMPSMLEGCTDGELAAACIWLRDVIIRTCAAAGEDPGYITPVDGHYSPHRLRTWNLAHQFTAGCWPAAGDALQICCRACLVDMTVCLGSAATGTTLRSWGEAGDAALEAYVARGGELPRPAGSPAGAPAPAFTPGAEAPPPP